jgi:hypothetical protein
VPGEQLRKVPSSWLSSKVPSQVKVEVEVEV